jgi:mRNA-degrading endonuclease YafQ of YafQ-DinJ toxin-antitoxin module
MREIGYSTQFQRNYKRGNKSSNNKDLEKKLKLSLDLLCADLPLTRKYKDCGLKGECVRHCITPLHYAIALRHCITPLHYAN